MSFTTTDKLQGIINSKEAIRLAINNKGVNVSVNDTFSSYASKIGQISGSTTGVTPTPPEPAPEPTYYTVRFLDFDGTILQENTITGGTITPPLTPEHDYLVFNSWNNTGYTNVDNDIDVGAIYDTLDDITYIWITLISGVTNLTNTLQFSKNSVGTMTIDWGDGITSTVTGSSGNKVHTYSNDGDYLIRVSYNDTYALNNTLFSANKILKKIYLSKYITSLAYTFKNALSLSFVSLPYTIATLQASVFQNCCKLISVNIPNGINSIGSTLFMTCYSLRSVSIPYGVTGVTSYSFYDCRALLSLAIPNSVTSIGDNTFYNCYSMKSVNIPKKISSIGLSAFYNCSSLLSNIIIPSGITTINNSLFYSCRSLSSVTIPSGVTSIGSSAFYSCYSLSSITIPSGVTSIGGSAFYSCYSLSSITIPSGVTSIGNGAFSYCCSLSSVTIPSGVTSIGNGAFYSCYSLSSITIPSGVTSIGNDAFSYCYSLETIIMQPTTPPTIQSSTFSIVYNGILTKIYVPSVSLDAYKTATNWSVLASYIFPIP